MTLHRLFVPPGQLGASDVSLTPAQSHYLRSVLRLERGARIELFDGAGARYAAELVDERRLRLGEKIVSQERRVDVVIVQALAKGEKLDLVVQKATELGATRIVPLASERSVVRLEAGRGAARAERWRRIAQEAARQCGRADVPVVDDPRGWDGVYELLRADPDRRGLFLDPEERDLRLSAAARGAPRLLVAVGPEGGWTPVERERAREEGLLPVGLGPLVLRTETAGLAALSVVLHVHGELG